MVLNLVSLILICFEIYGIQFYERREERNDQVVLMILNMEYSYSDNHKNNSKYSPILEYLIQEVERDNYRMMHNYMHLNVYVNYLERFDSYIQ